MEGAVCLHPPYISEGYMGLKVLSHDAQSGCFKRELGSH